MTDEKFFAWLDGELDAEQAAAMAARVAADPELAALADQHRGLGGRIRAGFDSVAAAPVPERIQQALKPSATVVDLGTRREASRVGRSPAGLPQWAAMAATLLVGLIAGTLINSDPGAPVELRNGKMYAAATLDQALDKQLASAEADDVRIGLTFRDESGAICRSFAGGAATGLACREGSDWQVRGLFAAPERFDGEYRMAAGADPNLAALIETTMAGDPFDANQERAAQAANWR